MAIALFDGWEIDADNYAYILGKTKWVKRKDGRLEKQMEHPRYYGSLMAALEGLSNILSREFVQSNDTGLPGAIMAQNEIIQRIENLVKGIDVTQLESLLQEHEKYCPEEEDEECVGEI